MTKTPTNIQVDQKLYFFKNSKSKSRRDDDDPRKGKEPTPPSLVPRAKTPPEGGTGGFFVRGGVQTSTMKKSDNVDDHVFMPGEKIGEAFHLSAEEKKPVVEPDNDGVEGFDRDMRDAKRAANGKSPQIRGHRTKSCKSSQKLLVKNHLVVLA